MRKQDRFEVINGDKLTPASKYALVFDKAYGIVMKVSIQDFGDDVDE